MNMHAGIKSKITVNDISSKFFKCNAVVHQGENESPCLFSLYIIDLEKYLFENGIGGFDSFCKYIEGELCIIMKLCIFFYAADTVI